MRGSGDASLEAVLRVVEQPERPLDGLAFLLGDVRGQDAEGGDWIHGRGILADLLHGVPERSQLLHRGGHLGIEALDGPVTQPGRGAHDAGLGRVVLDEPLFEGTEALHDVLVAGVEQFQALVDHVVFVHGFGQLQHGARAGIHLAQAPEFLRQVRIVEGGLGDGLEAPLAELLQALPLLLGRFDGERACQVPLGLAGQMAGLRIGDAGDEFDLADQVEGPLPLFIHSGDHSEVGRIAILAPGLLEPVDGQLPGGAVVHPDLRKNRPARRRVAEGGDSVHRHVFLGDPGLLVLADEGRSQRGIAGLEGTGQRGVHRHDQGLVLLLGVPGQVRRLAKEVFRLGHLPLRRVRGTRLHLHLAGFLDPGGQAGAGNDHSADVIGEIGLASLVVVDLDQSLVAGGAAGLVDVRLGLTLGRQQCGADFRATVDDRLGFRRERNGSFRAGRVLQLVHKDPFMVPAYVSAPFVSRICALVCGLYPFQKRFHRFVR